MDIIYLLVCIAVMLLVTSLAYAVWAEITNRALDYLKSIVGEKVAGIINLILFIIVVILIIGRAIAS